MTPLDWVVTVGVSGCLLFCICVVSALAGWELCEVLAEAWVEVWVEVRSTASAEEEGS
jgi:hypothetical protein